MLPRNPARLKLAFCALAALLAASACATRTKERGTLTRLTEPQVEALLRKWDDVQLSEDLEGITACLSTRLQYKKTYQGLGPTETVTGDYSKYMDSTKRGLDADAQNISTSRTINSIGVNPDGQTAAVVSEVRDLVMIEGNNFRSVSSGTMTIGIEDGRAVITGMDEVVSIEVEGRQSFQSTRD